MTSRRKFLKKLPLLSGLFLGSCGWRLGNVGSNYTNTSQPDQPLYIFTWTQYTDKELLRKFKAQTGMNVLADVYDSNDAMLAKLLAGGGGAYSIIYPSDYMVQKMLRRNLLTEIDHQKLIGMENLCAPKFTNPSYDPNNKHGIPFSWGTTGLIYDSEKLENPPQDWEYLWQNQEKLNKRITLLNDLREVMGAALRSLGYSYNSTNENEIKQAYEKLKKLKPAIAAFDTDAWQNQILAGDLVLAMCYSGDAVKISRENPKLKYVIPRSGSSLWTDHIVIPQTAPNIPGAYEWMNLILKPEVAAEISKRLNLATTNCAALELLPTEIREDENLFPKDLKLLERCERLIPLGNFEEVYQRYWTKLLTS